MAVATQYATGRRKCAIARAWVTGTAGDITINDQPLEKAFPRLTLRQIIQLPLELGGVAGKYSIKATVHGGSSTQSDKHRSHSQKKGRLQAFPFFVSV